MGRLNAKDLPTLTCHLNTTRGDLVSATAIPEALTPAAPVPVSLELSEQTVICGDALDILKSIPASSIDLVVTSPPYNVRVPYRSYDDRKLRAAYLAWMKALAAEMTRVLTDDGALFLNVGAGSDVWQAMDVAQQYREHLVLQNAITWIKSIAVDDITRGHVRPINSVRFLNRTHEQIFHFTKNGDVAIDRLGIGVPYSDKGNLTRWKGAAQDLRCRGNSWFIPYETTSSRGKEGRHPAPFPVELPRRCMKLHGQRGTVLDPFLGSGTTLVAARELGWRGVGIELDPEYAELARQRIAAVKVPGER